jgi:YHS domain-containing protein
MMLRVRVQRVVAELEPFSSLPSDPPPLQKGEPRTVHSCPDHPDNLGKRGGRCPLDRLELESRILAVNQRLRWWCPMHPEVTADRPGLQCDACGGMVLRPRVITYRPRGEVLAVPDSAVVDTGKRQVVFVERMPGMFEGVKVTLGERCGDWYPVVRGVESGQLVVVAGAFLLDAETRLDPSLAATYFGAGRIAPAQVDHGSERPSSHDRGAADRQAFCPVTRKPLGSMGTPVKVVVDGRTVFLCCQGCEERLRKDPKRFLEAAATPRP